MVQYLREILHLLGDDHRKLPLMILYFWISSLLDLAGIGLIGPYIALVVEPKMFDEELVRFTELLSLPNEHKQLLILIGIVLLIVFFLKSISGVWINKLIFQFSQQRQVTLRAYLMSAYQNLPYKEYLNRNSSEYIHNINTLTGQYSSGVLLVILRLLSDGIVAIVILGFLAWNSAPILVFLICLLGPVIYCYDRFFRNKLRVYGQELNKTSMLILQGVQESIEGLKEIRILGKEKYFYRIVLRNSEDYSDCHTSSHVISTSPRYFLELLMVGFIVFLVIGTLLLGKELKPLLPTLGMYGIASIRLFPIANMLSGSLVSLRFTRNSVSRLYQDYVALKNVNTVNLKNESSIVPKSFKNLNLDGVSFSYPNTTSKALNKISMEIKEGESIGLIGSSGAGKTTLIDVLLGLLEPQEGEIQYNGNSLKGVISEWYSQVAYLPQQVFLIDNSLRHNVALGMENHEIDDVRLLEALRQARLLELVEQLSQGIDTLVGERGIRLSGGQRQRVALARAFYHQRHVLIMDEATSALDNETEREIVGEIKHLKGKKTVIVIAHRLTTVQYCDRIYQLENGSINEQGTFDEVIKFHKPVSYT